jgi:hypothetical protein
MVTGDMDTEFFDAQRELEARHVVVLRDMDDMSGRSQASGGRETGEDRERVVQAEDEQY